MSRNKGVFAGLSTVLLMMGLTMSAPMWGIEEEMPDRSRADQLLNNGNWKEAYDVYRKLCLNAETDAAAVPQDLVKAVQCLNNLGRIADFDELVEGTIKAHSQNWRLLHTAANQYRYVDKNGFIIAGKFERGPHRGGGKYANTIERDRVRSLQLMQQAMPLAMADDQKAQVATFLFDYAAAFLGSHYGEAFHFQYLTNLDQLPDYDEGYSRFRQEAPGAPVDEDGTPLFPQMPKSWEMAANDGERWRWLLSLVEEVDPSRRNDARWQFADFLWRQFDVHTIREGIVFPVDTRQEPKESGTYALHTLSETETIARLATGIKRFALPDEFNFVRIFQNIAEEPRTGYGENALFKLTEIFENRRQYPRAAEYLKRNIELFGPGPEQSKKLRLDQIIGNWGRFETSTTQPAGKGATVEFTFRNANSVDFVAQRIDINKLLGDIKAYLRSNPQPLDGERMQIDSIGWRLVNQNGQEYLGEKVAQWNQKLEPAEKHFDRRITVTTPLSQPGAYLVTGTVAGGNVSKMVLWIDNTTIVHKQLSGANLYVVADAVTGKLIAGANVEFFGFRHVAERNNRQRILTTNFAGVTDANGLLTPDQRDLKNDFSWLIVARTRDGRMAHFGFRGVWTGEYYDAQYNEIKVFSITDRPVYRPGQTVHYKFWIRRAQYDNNKSDFANQTFSFELHDPKGEKLKTWSHTTDAYAGAEGEWQIPADATLGQYQLFTSHGGGSFRVEEYKKPEFEVTIEAPKKPVMLGEKITAKIEAKYYFGAPVTNATVKYKVLRSDHRQLWYPLAPWDWCYGRGYWWFSYDYPWYPGWNRWVGCTRPSPWWWPIPHTPPEVVAEREVPIGEDGIVSVEIDTLPAKELHGDTDHQYTITAEVRDESRRTIVGQGNVLVAREPFRVFSWLERGYHRVGDTVQAHFLAQTLDNNPVQGKGKLKLLKISYPDRTQKPVETEVQNWDLDTNEEGRADLQIRASEAGQYRLSYTVTDSEGHTIEGGYLFTVIGQGFDGRQFRFNNLELIPEKGEYAPNERVRLQINTDRIGSTVLLFLRPANGIYLPPQVLRIEGKSTVVEIPVTQKDMPNFFVEAMTIADGQLHNESKEIVVPPEKRVLNVEVVSTEKTYKPGQKAKVKIRVTDFQGENFVGQTVVSVYDKSVEYVAGGSNVPDIKEHFWKWRRQHQPQQGSSLERYSGNMTLPGKPMMGPLGVFGDMVADDLQGVAAFGRPASGGFGGMGGGGMRGGMAMAEGFFAAAPPGAMADRAMLKSDMTLDAAGESGQPAEALVMPTVRSNFADTALWVGSLETNNDGIAEVSLDMPENLTTWKIKVWAMGHGTQVGSGDVEVITRKDLIVRLQAPRFFVQKDEVVLSANIHNYLQTDKAVTAVLELEGGQLKPLGELSSQVMVAANSEQRVDWRVSVVEEGQATVRMKALTDEESDAMELKIPCYVHGMLKTESWAGTVRADQDKASVVVRVPAERRPEQSLLEVRYSPTLAGAMVDALPYLAEYPYGCTEQTLNRFLPSVITQKVLLEMNLNLEEIRDKRTNLNAQEIGDAPDRAKQWQRFPRNPVFDPAELDRMVKEGLTALTNMQCSDGGWGWFSGWGERSWPHTTAVVVHGLQVAQQNDQAIVPGVLENGVAWLKRYQAEQIQLLKNAATETKPFKNRADDLDAFVYMVLVDADAPNAEMRDFLYRDRIQLAVYSKAMFGVALQKQGAPEQKKLAMILQNLAQFLVQDAENETAYLRLPENNHWWFWYGDETEANAYYLKLLSRVEPKGVVAQRLVKYLLNNRKHSTYWNSTRDTALCVEAFADYLRATGENRPQMTVEIWFDGEKKKEVAIDSANLFSFDNRFILSGLDVPEGEHTIEIRRKGEGPVYFNAYLTNFTLEDSITAAGLEIKVARKFYRLIAEENKEKVPGSRGQAIDQKVEKYRREPIENLDVVKSGEMVEVELEIESKNDYEYLIFEDMKAAGFESAELRSGYTANGLGAYTEYRDNRVTFFVRALARGRHSISYRLRSEIPGKFSALPARGSGMYAPELRANSNELKVAIED